MNTLKIGLEDKGGNCPICGECGRCKGHTAIAVSQWTEQTLAELARLRVIEAAARELNELINTCVDADGRISFMGNADSVRQLRAALESTT